MDASSSQATAAALLAIFGLGFGLVSQVLTVAIQNAVDRRDLGIATASANLFRSLGGAIGAAAFGAIFAGHVDRLPTVFLVAAPFAILGLLVVLLLEEVPLRGPREPASGSVEPSSDRRSCSAASSPAGTSP